MDIDTVIRAAKDGDRYAHTQGQFTLLVDYPTVSVLETTPRGVRLAAHSCMRADFEASVAEFVEDYLPGGIR
jgi:hypothetical protein